MANRLIDESSPYLLQHAHNPVDWYPWGPEALAKAREENKLIIVSVGYSACHWCHVMERECFEQEDVARIMNEHFVCIKVDREERPDIDQIYILAVQLMTGQGGWPLNCICLPDQRPIYGGTYFRRSDWMSLLTQIAAFWKDSPGEALRFAEKLTAGLAQPAGFSMETSDMSAAATDLSSMVQGWRKLFDQENGGYKGAPKFPLPNNWLFMLRYSHLAKDQDLAGHVKLSLDKMAAGGIYDQIGGGMARYAVDDHWHIPHFEKMLYDNGQILSLYSEAYLVFKEERYKDLVYQTVEWLKRELLSPFAGFYSALDADSEGVEGKFYSFSLQELQTILTAGELAVLAEAYGVTASGNWREEHTNVFFRAKVLPENEHLLDIARAKVLSYRNRRIHPGLDNKILCSWNALMLKGLADAYRAFGDEEFLNLALNNAYFLKDNLLAADYSLSRVYRSDGARSQPINGFLDDYALLIDAFIALYEVTFDESWLRDADAVCGYALHNFYDPGTGLFFYTSQNDTSLIARKHEIHDNVIPASNSIMANNLFKLGNLLQEDEYLEQSALMLEAIYPDLLKYGKEYSNWAILLLNRVFGIYEVVICGEEAALKRHEFEKTYIPNKIILGGNKGSLPLLQEKLASEGTKIYVCKNRSCALPVTEVAEALKQIK